MLMEQLYELFCVCPIVPRETRILQTKLKSISLVLAGKIHMIQSECTSFILAPLGSLLLRGDNPCGSVGVGF